VSRTRGPHLQQHPAEAGWRREGGRLAAAVLLLALIAAPPARAADGGAAPLRVATRVLEVRAYDVTLPAKVGVLEAAASQELAFEVSGRLQRILGEGARVEADGEVAALDTELEEAELRRAALLLSEAESDLARVRGLRRSAAASESDLDRARTAVGLRRAERDAARERLARRRLRARFDGVVSDVRIEPGEVATPGRVIARLLNFELMELEVAVPGHQVGRVRAGAPVRVSVPALEGELFDGQVHVVAPAASEGGALFEVDVLVPNARGRLRPGMSARARIVTEALERALLVPLAASVQREGRRVVFFVDEGRARAVPVDDVALQGDVLVLPGSIPWREIVLRGQHDLRDGFAVVVDNAVLAGPVPLGVGGP